MSLARAVEFAAKARGVWLDYHNGAKSPECGVAICKPDGEDLGIWSHRSIPQRPDCYTILVKDGTAHVVDATTAALWLLCLDLPDTDQACPGSEQRGYAWEQVEVDNDDWPDGTDWKAVPHSASALTGTTTWERPCTVCSQRTPCATCNGIGSIPRPRTGRPGGAAADPSCSDCAGEGERTGEPTGRVPRSWGAVLLGAMTTTVDVQGWGHDKQATYEGHPRDREALTVKADELQACGDPLGVWLSLWLAETPCSNCGGDGCMCCDHTGRELDSGHAADIEAALTRATFNTSVMTPDEIRRWNEATP